MVTIREGRAGDEAAMVRMGREFLASTPYGDVLGFEPEVLHETFGKLLEHGVVFVAEVEGAVVGMICGMPFRDVFGGEAMLDELAWWVDLHARGTSAGPRLLAAWEAWARQNGIVALRMVAPRGAYQIAAFYERHGYRPIELAFLKRLDYGTPPVVSRRARDRGTQADEPAASPAEP